LGAATSYENPAIQSLVQALKFRRVKRAAHPLAGILIEYIASLGIIFDNSLVIPVPLSKPRLKGRGFNQAELIACPIAQAYGLTLNTGELIRARHAKPQSEMRNVAERRENIRGAFAVTPSTVIRGKKIVLIDDVTTSGATFLEAARALKAAGAGRIIALAVAKA
jgi:ComF family protein